MGALVELQSVSKIYNLGRPNEVTALDSVTLRIDEQSMVCLKGASGSGKSTLLSIIGCIFPPTSGRATIGGRSISRMPDRFLTIHRRMSVGFIFQQLNLLPELTVRDNITLPLLPLGVAPRERKKRAVILMERFSIAHRENFQAGQISGGEQQRVAICRALINDPPIVLADEPTAHLDTGLSREFMSMMTDLQAAGKTVILTSHDPLVTDHPAVHRIISIRDGRIDVS